MAYLAVDLDVPEKCEHVGRSSDQRSGDILLGLVRLWAWCFRERVDIVTINQLSGFFGTTDDRLWTSLESFRFLSSHSKSGQYRVRGASRYLRVKQAQSEAAARTNAKRRTTARSSVAQPTGTPNGIAHGRPSLDDAQPTGTPNALGSNSDALTASSEQRAASSKLEGTIIVELGNSTTTDQEAPDQKNGMQVQAIFNYWREKLGHPKAKLDQKRRRKIEWVLKTYGEETAKKAIDGCASSEWHRGKNPDGKVWDEPELIFRDAAHVERFAGIQGKVTLPEDDSEFKGAF